MSTFLYQSAYIKLNDGTWSWPSLPVRAAFVGATYTADRDHQFLSSVPANALIVRDLELSHLRSTGQLAKGIIPVVESLLDGREVIALLLYRYTGDDATSELIYYSSDGDGAPFTPQGFNYSAAYRQEDGGFFQL